MKKPVIIDEYDLVDYAYLNHLLMEDFEKSLGVLLRKHSVDKDMRRDIVEHMKFALGELDEQRKLGPHKNRGICFNIPKNKKAELLKVWRKTIKYQKFCIAWKSA